MGPGTAAEVSEPELRVQSAVAKGASTTVVPVAAELFSVPPVYPIRPPVMFNCRRSLVEESKVAVLVNVRLVVPKIVLTDPRNVMKGPTLGDSPPS